MYVFQTNHFTFFIIPLNLLDTLQFFYFFIFILFYFIIFFFFFLGGGGEAGGSGLIMPYGVMGLGNIV